MDRKKICLNMIVKNESQVIQRCLASVKDLIDYWVIVDTGSVDGTQKIVKECLREISGEFHERPWVDFGFNRNEALELARNKADYILFIDADDRLAFSSDFEMPELVSDLYIVTQKVLKSNRYGFSSNFTILMIKDLPDFKWEGVLHESLTFDQGRRVELLKGVVSEYHHDGHRSQDPDSFGKDIQILEQAFRENPSDSRNVFYLAQTYRAAEKFSLSLNYYKKRVEMGGRADEVFYSLVCIAIVHKILKADPESFMKMFCLAYLHRPFRAEPLYELTRHLIETGDYLLGYLIAEYASSFPIPFDLYVDTWIYEWGVLLQFYICSQNIGNYHKAYELVQKLLSNPNYPQEYRLQLEMEKLDLETMLFKV